MTRIVLLLACLLFSLAAHAAPEDAIVGLYVTLQAGRSDLGTGFFSSEQGQIVTAYHVIHGAKKIKAITSEGAIYPDIRISFVEPSRDLAVLQIMSRPRTPIFMSFVDRVPDPDEELTIIGYPRGLPRQHIRARSTSDRFISSYALQNSRGKRLFNTELDILLLDATIYPGMSGAPVIGADGVLGILSGSFDEGGTIAWLIPSKYLNDLQTIDKTPAEMTAWPNFELMTSGFMSLSRQFEVDAVGERMLEAYLDSVERYSEAGQRIGLTAMKLQAQILITRPFLQMALTDPSVTQDRQTALDFTENPINSLLQVLDSYGQAHTGFGEAALEFGNRGFELLDWAENLARSDPDVQSYLWSVDQKFADAGAGSYYEGIGSDPHQLARSVAEFSRTIAPLAPFEDGYTPEGFRQFVRAILDLFAAMEPDVAKNASATAISLMRGKVMNMRNLSVAFEPLVYRQ